MTVSRFIDLKKKRKPGAFRWHVLESYRLWLLSEGQILGELKTSPTSLHI